MKLLQKILIKLNGLHYSQEYLCFANDTLPQQLNAYLVQDQQIIRNTSNSHLFVGYCPLIFAFSTPDLPTSIQIILSARVLQPNEKINAKDAIAMLQLTLIKDSNGFVYYEGIMGKHRFQSVLQQYIGKKYNEWYNKKPGNVYLHDNLYKQVQIAYAIPRPISLITVGGGELFNLFPTDLHGQADETHYIISLRTGGKACQQVMAEGKLLLSQMKSEAYKTVYSLGKNHMQELKEVNSLPFTGQVSENFSLPLPQMAISYKELELVDSFMHGIHTIMLFTIVNHRQLQPGVAPLVHIHNSYATWRYKTGIKGNYLMR